MLQGEQNKKEAKVFADPLWPQKQERSEGEVPKFHFL
jgi:hypothetical protein